MPPNKILELINHSKKENIIGIDEVGYGSIAGPIYVCAFMAPKGWQFDGVKDSKVLSEKTRKELCDQLYSLPSKENGIGFSIVNVHPNSSEYKEYGTNVHGALKFLYWKAAQRCLEHANQAAIIVLDGSIKFPEFPYSLGESISLPKADALIPQVSAASIIAKVYRDNYMEQLSKEHPEYNWSSNKGYPSPEHLAALKKYSYCSEHRIAYEPIKSMIK